MNLKKCLNRFSVMRSRYIGVEISFGRKIFLVVDYLFALIIHGASISDYFAYGFYKLRRNGRKEYITYRRFHTILNKCNRMSDRNLFRDKSKFNNIFSKYLGRDWIDVDKIDMKQFVLFCQSHPVIFIKESCGYRGIGTRKIETREINTEDLYKSLIMDGTSHYIAEEQISQIGILSDLHPWSINTIRIVTVYDTVKDEVFIMNARLRIGNKKNSVDNFHFDGIGANIDVETGIIDTVGYDVYNNLYLKHPLTGKQIVGFQIPYWEESKKFVKEVAKSVPTIKYVGWDLVLQEKGNLLLIEGNDNADHDFQQLHNKGLWNEYKSIITRF